MSIDQWRLQRIEAKTLMGFWIVYNIKISQHDLLIQYVWILIEYSSTKLTSVKLIWRKKEFRGGGDKILFDIDTTLPSYSAL